MIWMMLGWLSAASAVASFSKRVTNSGSLASRGGSTFTATVRSSDCWRASHTSPMPPRPSTSISS